MLVNEKYSLLRCFNSVKKYERARNKTLQDRPYNSQIGRDFHCGVLVMTEKKLINDIKKSLAFTW